MPRLIVAILGRVLTAALKLYTMLGGKFPAPTGPADPTSPRCHRLPFGFWFIAIRAPGAPLLSGLYHLQHHASGAQVCVGSLFASADPDTPHGFGIMYGTPDRTPAPFGIES